MKIVIMRHGRPVLDLEAIKSQRMPSAQLGQIVNAYELSDLDPMGAPDEDSICVAKECAISISSDLPRAISSSKLLGFEGTNRVEPCFREPALPHMEWRRPKLALYSWAILFRLAWLCGFSKNGESIHETKARSRLGADKLELFARESEAVLHVGHGIMNRLLVRELRRRKWLVKKRTGEKYWSYTILEYGANQWATQK